MDFMPSCFFIVRNGHLYTVVAGGEVPSDIDRTMHALEHIPEENRRLSQAVRVRANEAEGVLWVWLAGDTVTSGCTW